MPTRLVDAKDVPKRECGDCDLCCEANAIEAVDSPPGERCQHMSVAHGCNIYGQHPKECKDFACLWLSGVIDEAARPDRCGVVFTMDCSSRDPRGGPFPIIVASEKRTGSANGRIARDLITQMRKIGLPVVVCHRDKAKTVELTVGGNNIKYGPTSGMDSNHRANIRVDLARDKNYFDLMGVPIHLRDQFVTGGKEPTRET